MEAIESIDVQRARCEQHREMLHDLVRIHIDIDTPKRRVESDEPNWILRLRKVCLHAMGISKCEVSADGMHVMATELRAAYEQMDAVWKCLPDEFRIEEDKNWWSVEAKNKLAEFNHPTPASLGLPLATGGFGDTEAPESYLTLTVWLGRLGCGYGLALAYLARVLEAKGNFDSRIRSVLVTTRS